ncbi:MAG: transglutaminaseTgpA domain-containing protein [Actinomycetota bacterium]|nr:transglutaminaseTgpA domain-containing protein [Actinomycetota bacterium]
MPGKAHDYFQRLTAPREIEESRPFRAAVWASVCVSLIALGLQEVTSASLIITCLVLVSLGFYFSWRRSHKRNISIKLVIAMFTLVALASFLRQIYRQPYDPRLPLAELFLWVQVLHSFDLPRRKDLVLSLVSSVILLSLAGSFALSASFAWVALLYLAAALPALYFAQISRLRSLSAVPERSRTTHPSRRRMLVVFLLLIVIISAVGMAIGAAIPRVSASYMSTLPFSLRRAFSPSQGFEFSNPGYPDLPSKPPDDALEVNPEAYFGFSPFLDLRARGTLVDKPVMRVCSSEPAYWRGIAFQEYNGYSWLVADEEPQALYAREQPFMVEHPQEEACLWNHRIVQTYYIVGDEASVIFAAQSPSVLYYPSDYIYQDSSGLKSPFPLSDGLVYSVVSNNITPGEEFADVDMEAFGDFLLPYLEVPELPPRVLGLAEEIIPWGETPYRRAEAIKDYLESHYDYSLDVPPLPAGEDALDFFLFEQGSGYCEHFATAYALLCRLAGIPARVVTGYATGEYNPFTDLYEVSLADAHAWVEIYLQGVGWVTCEPTPSFSLPDPGRGSGSLWILGDFIEWAGKQLSSILPSSLRSAVSAAFGAIASGADSLFSSLAYSFRHAAWLPLLFLFILLLFPLLYLTSRRSRRKPAAGVDDGEAVSAMRDFLGSLNSLGIARQPSQTAGEFIGELGMLVPGIRLSSELRLFEAARYGGRPLRREQADRLRAGFDGALEEIDRAKREGKTRGA